MTLLFVYGTLKRGCKNHHHLAGQTYTGEARTAPGYRLYDLGDYPGMIVDPSDREGVTGELWSVTDAALAHLDDFEGLSDGLYRREAVRLMTSSSETIAQTYVYNRDPGTRPIGATWTER
ncbi:MAG: gamma-glutamylcyclotransferase family protein [Rariglobus sp.]